MIKHIVLWKLKEEAGGSPKSVNALEMKRRLEALAGLIPQVEKLEVGLDFEGSAAAMDLALYSEFKSRQDLEAYQKHPEHQRVVEFVKTVVAERKVVDYEV